MNIVKIKENKDGSANVVMELSDEEIRIFVEIGITHVLTNVVKNKKCKYFNKEIGKYIEQLDKFEKRSRKVTIRSS